MTPVALTSAQQQRCTTEILEPPEQDQIMGTFINNGN